MLRSAFWPLLLASIISACAGGEIIPRPANAAPAGVATVAPRPIAPPPRTAPPPEPAKSIAAPEAPDAIVQGIRALWASFPDRAGIAVIRADSDWSIAHRGGEPMPQQSVSKLWVAITLLQAVDEGRLKLSDPVTVRASDLTVFSRAADSMTGPNGWQTTLGTLLERALTKSDNTANDVLLRRVGGPAAVRAMISDKGLGAIRFGDGEHLLQAGTAGVAWREEYRKGQAFQAARSLLPEATRRAAMDRYVTNPPDGAAPIAIARALLRLAQGELLSPDSTRRILRLMTDSQTGKLRLRGGVPADWKLAHKTGTGQDLRGRTAGYNDVGLMTAPDGTLYAVVVMIADTTRPIIQRMQLMQGVSATVAANHFQSSQTFGRASSSPPRGEDTQTWAAKRP